mgnify:CR=1 FL=1
MKNVVLIMICLLALVACSDVAEERADGVGDVASTTVVPEGLMDSQQEGDLGAIALVQEQQEIESQEQSLELGGRVITCDDGVVRQLLYLRSSGRHTSLTEQFAGGSPIRMMLPGQGGTIELDPSVYIVFEYLRDREKYSHFNLELDADFQVHCSGSEIALMPIKVHGSRLRRFRKG